MQLIYAHRGASGYAPENTLRAFALAADMQADGVELDVQLTRDGQLVVFHDETLDRVTDHTGRLCDRTWAELKQIPVTSWRDRGMVEPIPLLRDVLLLLKERGLKVNIELKNSILPYPGMEEKVLALVQETGMKEQVLYSSFNHHSMLKVKRLCPTARCGLLYEAMLVRPWEYVHALGMDALHPYHTEAALPGETENAHALGLMVNPWTVNSENDLKRMIACKADIIITNYPDRARLLLQHTEACK